MWRDPIVEEIHKVREALAAKFQYDVQALGKYFQAQQQAEHREVVTRAPRRVPGAAFGFFRGPLRTCHILCLGNTCSINRHKSEVSYESLP